MTKTGKKTRKYTNEFKQRLANLYCSDKRRCSICKEYDITYSLFDKWVKQAEISGSLLFLCYLYFYQIFLLPLLSSVHNIVF